MKFSDLPVGRKCITAPQDGREGGIQSRYILVKTPECGPHGTNVIRFCDGTLDKLHPNVEIIEVE